MSAQRANSITFVKGIGARFQGEWTEVEAISGATAGTTIGSGYSTLTDADTAAEGDGANAWYNGAASPHACRSSAVYKAMMMDIAIAAS